MNRQSSPLAAVGARASRVSAALLSSAHVPTPSPASPLACRSGLHATLAFLVALSASACTVDVGPCDPFAAREVVYLRQLDPDTREPLTEDPFNGTPMFAGQAIMQVSCGDSRQCHASGATGSARNGVPAGLDFDLPAACDAAGCLPGAVQRLRANQSTVFDYRRHILRTLDRGTMPPGAAGTGVRNQAGEYVRIDTSDQFFVGGVETGEALPEIETAEGRAIVQNWLACGAPVVERFEVPNTPQDSGRNCRGSTDCVYRVDANANPPLPTWDSIFEVIIFPACGAKCHGPDAPGESIDSRDESQLDLSEPDLAYAQMVNRVAEGDECFGTGTLIVPGDADASLLIDKMASNSPSCGDPMPSGAQLYPEEFMSVLRQWINEGALDN